MTDMNRIADGGCHEPHGGHCLRQVALSKRVVRVWRVLGIPGGGGHEIPLTLQCTCSICAPFESPLAKPGGRHIMGSEPLGAFDRRGSRLRNASPRRRETVRSGLIPLAGRRRPTVESRRARRTGADRTAALLGSGLAGHRGLCEAVVRDRSQRAVPGASGHPRMGWEAGRGNQVVKARDGLARGGPPAGRQHGDGAAGMGRVAGAACQKRSRGGARRLKQNGRVLYRRSSVPERGLFGTG